jgi:NAD-dependent deacetylase
MTEGVTPKRMMSRAAPAIVILTGAGVSRESGLATFRDRDGIWARVRLEDVATPEAFAADPARVHAFYNARRAQLRDPAIVPNRAHAALAAFDRRWPGSFLLVTQNVDDLHARAGAQRMVAMHGELMKARCAACAAVTPWTEDLSTASACPCCARRGAMRPHVVWFGERPLALDRIEAALARCDLFVAIGTSAQVHPAAGFIDRVAGRARSVELNLERSAVTDRFDRVIQGPASATVPVFLDELLRDAGA